MSKEEGSPFLRDALREAMARDGVSQGRLAEEIGVEQPYISQLLAGTCNPSLACFARICVAMGLSPGELLSMAQKKKPSSRVGKARDMRMRRARKAATR